MIPGIVAILIAAVTVVACIRLHTLTVAARLEAAHWRGQVTELVAELERLRGELLAKAPPPPVKIPERLLPPEPWLPIGATLANDDEIRRRIDELGTATLTAEQFGEMLRAAWPPPLDPPQPSHWHSAMKRDDELTRMPAVLPDRPRGPQLGDPGMCTYPSNGRMEP